MKERLIQLLDLEQLSPSKFADIIGVQRSSISHVISGRNKPSFDFLQKTLKAFPGLNASWLMLGEGNMYEQMGRNVSGNLFDAPVAGIQEQSPDHISDPEVGEIEAEAPEAAIFPDEKPDMHAETAAPEESIKDNTQAEGFASAVSHSKKKIMQVMVIYEDDTFRAYTPAH